MVFDLTNGQAVGLHFSGSFLATNYAVRADVVKKLLDDIHSGRRRRQPGGVSLTFPADGGETDLIDETESVASDYRDRGGYDPEFLGSRFVVDLPTVTRHADDVLDFEFDGETQTELRYEHFSVVMSRSRRMCFLSGCNIDGNLPKKSPRAAWKVGSANSQIPADHEGVLRRPPEIQPWPHDPTRGSRLGHPRG